MLRLVRSFASSCRAMAAVEFAFIAPIMILMFFGAIELSAAVNCKARVTRVASTTADLIAQSPAVATADVTNIFGAANAILYPFPASGARIIVSSLVDDGHGGAKVAWSDAQNTSPRSVGSSVAVPAGLIVSGSGSSVIYAEINYTYSSPTMVVLKTVPVSMTGSFYSRPRRSATVKHL